MFGLGARDAVLASLEGVPVRGFPASDGEDLDLVALASCGDLLVERTTDGYVIRAAANQQVDAGMLKQRMLAIAVAHGLQITVVVKIS